jgi:alkylation response protein AidB-like acyl-CoA dehydrogenase
MRSIDDFTRPLEYLSPLDGYLGEITRRWAEREVMPVRRGFDEDWERHETIEPAFKSLMGELGFQRFFFPEDMGGFGMGHSDYAGVGGFRVCEEISRADSAMGVAFGVLHWPLLMICKEPHVNRRLCAEFAPMFCETEEAVFAANAMTEPQGGSDIENLDLLKGSTIQTTATLDGDEWVINGHKLWPTNSGGAANLFGVVCTTKLGSSDPDDFAFIFCPADLPGVTQGKPYQKAGMAADKNSDIWFDNVRVPAWYRAHGPGLDFLYFKEMVSWGNVLSVAFASGAMLNIFELLKGFCEEKTFRGKPLKENDDIAGVLADIARDIEITRIVGYQSARMLDRPDLYGDNWSDEIVAKCRAYKCFACDKAVEISGKALDIMGPHGSDRARDIEKHWRDIKIIQLWLGGKQLGQMEVARWFYECETL